MVADRGGHSRAPPRACLSAGVDGVAAPQRPARQSPVVRSRACGRRSGTFDHASEEPSRWLIAALGRGDDRVSPSTLIALLARRSPTAGTVEVLATELRRPESASAAAEALGRLAVSLAAPVLVGRLAEQPSAGLIELVNASSEMNFTASLPSIRALRFHPRPKVAAPSRCALEARSHPCPGRARPSGRGLLLRSASGRGRSTSGLTTGAEGLPAPTRDGTRDRWPRTSAP